MLETDGQIQRFQGQAFSRGKLNFLKPSWTAHYRSVVQAFSAKEFFVSYESEKRVSKTFFEYDRDVRSALERLQRDFRDDEVIVVASDNSYAMTVYQMATLLSGKILCPMNPNEGADRLNQKRNQLKQRSALLSTLDGGDRLTLPLATASSSHFPELSVDRVAVQVFTSGSTGYSKIVEQTEANILSNVDALIQHHKLDASSTIATPLPLFHVNAFAFSLLCSFAVGGRLILLRNAAPELIFRTVAEEKVHILSVIPSHLRALLGRGKGGEFSGLRYVVTAAAPLSVDLARKFIERFQVRVIQGYGLSEAVNFSAVLPIDLTDAAYERLMWKQNHPSIGVAIRGNEIRVLRPDGSICAEREEGEIAIRGWNVARGYKDASAGVFEKDDLKTGDLGYFVRDSELQTEFFFISGRRKDVIKRAGETISLREVDDLIASFGISGVDAITVSFPNLAVGEELGLVCRAESGADAHWKETLVNKIKSEIPALLRPRVLWETNGAVRTPSGKPVRWAFQDRFKKCSEAIVASNPHWVEL